LTLGIPSKLEPATRWLKATIEVNTGPGTPYPVPLRHLLIKGGRGSGKSYSVAKLCLEVVNNYGVRCLCARETQKSIDESVYQLLLDMIAEGQYTTFQPTKTSIGNDNGGSFMFAGLRQQDVGKLKSAHKLALCWVEEAHTISQHSLEVLAPTIRGENSVIIYTYNPELEDDPVHQTYALNPQPDVCVVELNWRDNYWFPQVLEEEKWRTWRQDDSPGKVRYHWIWEGQTLPAVEGAIFANEVAKFQQDGRILNLDYDPKGRVYGVMDLGWGVMTLALWQRFASTMQLIDYYEVTHMTYAQLTHKVRADHPDVRWGKIFMPHDASHRDPKYGKSHFDVMREQEWQVEQIPQIGVENYIEAGRGLFGNAYMADSGNCRKLLHCLKRFRRQVPTTTDHPGSPMKDEFSHGAETWCYSAVVADKMVNDDRRVKDPYKVFTEGQWAG
jgi:phage terminase large subunit